MKSWNIVELLPIVPDEPITTLQRALYFGQHYLHVVSSANLPQGILERLDAGEVIIGDGSYVNTLEKRGYVKVEILSRA